MCAVPSFLATAFYKLQGETYIPTAETDGEKNSGDENVAAENAEQDAVETVDVFEENKELLLEFTQENWGKKRYTGKNRCGAAFFKILRI